MLRNYERNRIRTSKRQVSFYIIITFFFILQTMLTLISFYFLNKINFSFLFSGISLFFYYLISIILFLDICFIINYIHFKENTVQASFFVTFIAFKILELFFLFFISQYIGIESKYIFYIYITLAISLLIQSINLIFNIISYKRFKNYIIAIIVIIILNNITLFLFYFFDYFDIKLLNYIIFSILYSIFLALFNLINYRLIIGHAEDKEGFYSLFSSVLIYFGIFIKFFEQLGAHKINT